MTSSRRTLSPDLLYIIDEPELQMWVGRAAKMTQIGAASLHEELL